MTSNRALILVTGLVLTLLSACGPRGSGYAPAENALQATPGTTLTMPGDAERLPEAGGPRQLRATADTGDSNGMQPLPSFLEPAAGALGTRNALEAARATNEAEAGLSSTLTDELNRDEQAPETAAPAETAEPAAQPEAQAPAAEGAAGAEAASFAWAQLGEETFSANCAACHQATGQGVPGAFPPLADHLPDLYNAEGGRSYLIQVVLYGLQGAISVAGSSYNGVMPPFAQLSDEQLAATLNHELTSWGNDAQVDAFEPILPEEIAAERDAGLSSAQVYGARPDLGE